LWATLNEGPRLGERACPGPQRSHGPQRARPIDIGERLKVLKDYPTSPGCTSPFAPIWITEMVRRDKFADDSLTPEDDD
jgi:hypothetical protein